MSVVDEQPCISVITLLRGEKEFIPLIKANFQEFNYPKDKLDLIIIDDGKESLLEEFLDDDRYLYLYLNESEIKEFIEKINFPNDKDDILKNYQTRVKRLPNGFKRDYGVGMSSNEYFFHMDYDTSYHKDSITRKLKFLKKNRIDCVYNSNILCHDFHSKDYTKLYKSESPYRLYESTLFHNKEYWSNGGFKWSDITNEGRFFSDNHGPQRRMDNYYDSVKYHK
jgi:DNA-binding ferritin-like protein (Dps family)